MFSLLQYDPDKILENFLNKYLPGFKIGDPLDEIPTVLAAKNPDALIRMNALGKAKIPCTNGTLAKIRYFNFF